MPNDGTNRSSSDVEQLMGIEGGAQVVVHDSKRDRFMPFNGGTSIGSDLNANTIIIGETPTAIATQYPYKHQVEAQLKLLIDQQAPVLVVLASSTDIQNHQLSAYFAGSATFGELTTKSKFEDYIDLSETTEVKVFKLTISGHGDSFVIPVLHVHNWPDHRTIRAETTAKLVELIESTITANDQADNKALPVIHCKAGVGRTGQTIAAIALKNQPSLSLDTIIKDMRASRNDQMVQNNKQMRTLLEMASSGVNDQEHAESKPPFSWRKLFGMK
jgi:protein tyrosine phosphatase